MGHTVLIIEDSEAIRGLIRSVLAETGMFGTVLEATDGLAGFKILRSQPVDLVLCDLMMAGLDGFKFLALKRADVTLQDVPVIVITGQDDVAIKVRALESGASDYLVKPFHAAEVIARARLHLKVRQLQHTLREKNRLLEDMVRRDPLTLVANRRALDEALEAEFARCGRYGRPFSLLLVDLDHFKKVNDTHGHLAGDDALVATAQRLTAQRRANDVVGRFGGEEFVVVLPETGSEGAQRVAERCRAAIAQSPIQSGDMEFRVTASIGVATAPDPRITSVEKILGLADEALYAAKDAGRNRVHVA